MTSAKTSCAPALFVTGASRSGTSLLDKLLSKHPDMDVLSQPLPRLYVEAKRRFLASGPSSELAQAFPLSDLFADTYADPATFTAYLRDTPLAPDWLLATLRDMQGFSGVGVQPPLPPEALVPTGPTDLAAFVTQYLAAVSERDVAQRGCKEVFAEEYIPYFLQSGSRVILLLRDPRDVVASVFGGVGARYAGAGLPLLFVLRHWRKSVGFALAHLGNPNLKLLRYEDLVSQPAEQMAALADWLDLPPFPDPLSGPLRDSTGAEWLSNSSHDPVHGISQDSIGRGLSALPGPLIRAIETLCGPEMHALGYAAPQHTTADRSQILTAITEPCPNPRAQLAAYVWDDIALQPEHQRLTGLDTGDFTPRLHLFQAAFDHLTRPTPLLAVRT